MSDSPARSASHVEGSVQDEFLTVIDIAELLKVNQQTVRNWIDQGRLPAVRIGRRVRVRRAILDHVLAEGETAHPPASAAMPRAEARVELASIVERARGLLRSSTRVPEAQLTECLQLVTDAVESMLRTPDATPTSKNGSLRPEPAA